MAPDGGILGKIVRVAYKKVCRPTASGDLKVCEPACGIDCHTGEARKAACVRGGSEAPEEEEAERQAAVRQKRHDISGRYRRGGSLAGESDPARFRPREAVRCGAVGSIDAKDVRGRAAVADEWAGDERTERAAVHRRVRENRRSHVVRRNAYAHPADGVVRSGNNGGKARGQQSQVLHFVCSPLVICTREYTKRSSN